MNPIIQEFYDTGAVKDVDGNIIDGTTSSIDYEEGLLLYNTIRRTKAKRTLEIGMAYGLSTLFMCQAHRDNGLDGSHTAIDPEQSTYFQSIGLLNIQRAGLDDLFRFYEGPSFGILPQLANDAERFDFVLIDGMHTFDYTLVDFFFIDMMLESGGCIVFDDTWMPSVRKALMYAIRNRQYRLMPELIENRQPIWKRMGGFLQEGSSSKLKLKIIAKYYMRNPLDIASVYSTAYLSLKGHLHYWGVQKMAEDEREWDFHKVF